MANAIGCKSSLIPATIVQRCPVSEKQFFYKNCGVMPPTPRVAPGKMGSNREKESQAMRVVAASLPYKED